MKPEPDLDQSFRTAKVGSSLRHRWESNDTVSYQVNGKQLQTQMMNCKAISPECFICHPSIKRELNRDLALGYYAAQFPSHHKSAYHLSTFLHPIICRALLDYRPSFEGLQLLA